jgi:ABC-type transporter Mla subunit MlaD
MSVGGDDLREERVASPVVRALVAALILVVAALIVILLLAGGGGYRVTAEFVNAGQLVKGSEVRVAGVTAGTVEDIAVSDNGTAEVC